MKSSKFYRQIVKNQNNVSFREMESFLVKLGFIRRGGKGGHFVFKKENISELVNLQNHNGEVLPYQVRQVIKIICENKLIG